jgi:hypothetical protein
MEGGDLISPTACSELYNEGHWVMLTDPSSVSVILILIYMPSATPESVKTWTNPDTPEMG